MISPFDWKPTILPKDGLTLVIDTREKEGHYLFQNPPENVTVMRKVLPHGDYSVWGYEKRICVELKRLSDFLGYIGQEREKTRKKQKAMMPLYWKALVVQVDSEFTTSNFSQVNEEDIRNFLKGTRVDYSIHVYHNKSTYDIERYILDHLAYAVRCLQKLEAEELKSLI